MLYVLSQVLKKYKESLSDLMSILKLEPGNSAAKKECDTVKEAYKKVCDVPHCHKCRTESSHRRRACVIHHYTKYNKYVCSGIISWDYFLEERL